MKRIQHVIVGIFLLMLWMAGQMSTPNLNRPTALGGDTSFTPVVDGTKAPEHAPEQPDVSDVAQKVAGRSDRQHLDNWTVLVYLSADNNLDNFAFEVINDLESVGPTPAVNVIVFVDYLSYPVSGARCYNITFDADLTQINSPIIYTLSEPNMGDPETLEDFIFLGQYYAPAQRYLLIFSDHGHSFQSVCSDYTNFDRLTPDEIATALSNSSLEYIDVVAFEACLMQHLEVVYELRDLTDYVVASEEWMSLNGFPHEDWLADLVADPDTSPLELSEILVDRYLEAYGPGGRYYSDSMTFPTISAVDTNAIDTVAQRLDDLTTALLPESNLQTYFESLCIARAATQSYVVPFYTDLGDFAAETILSATEHLHIATLAQHLQHDVDQSVIFEGHFSGVRDSTGLGFGFTTYGSLPLALLADTQWDEFMSAFCAIGETPATAPLLRANYGVRHGYLDGKTDEFYFLFTPTSAGTFTFRIESAWGIDEDLDFYLYDAGMNELVSSATTDTSTEVISYYIGLFFPFFPPTYILKVVSSNYGSIIYGKAVVRFSVVHLSLAVILFDLYIYIILFLLAGYILVFFVIFRYYRLSKIRPRPDPS
ncbi:MAG: clostripain-related cysteine peptidase [Promethearchaeota archaeon]